jgi:mannose-6-phosphate isomerase-like protein (cupin superfamily)
MSAINLVETYVGWDGAGGATTMPVGADFWQTLDSNPNLRATLIAVMESETDWTSWEMHPHGDEIVYLLSGAATMVFERAGEAELTPLTPGHAVIVPAGTWHRALVAQPCRMLFVTYGEATQHKPA